MKIIQFEYPWALLLTLLVPVLLYLKRRYIHAVSFSQVSFLEKNLIPSFIKRSWDDMWIVFFLLSSVLAIANIQYSSFWQKTYLESKWIMIVQDLSGSMNRPGGEQGESTLGDIALQGASAFIDMRQKDDLVGIIGYSSFAQLISPPTFDRDILKKKLALLSRRSDSIIFRELTVGGATNASYAAWLALCTFFMLLPEESQPTFGEMNELRSSLLGETVRKIEVPQKLEKIDFGHGMAIILFTDGRIEANKSDEDMKRGLPNFVNVIRLIKKLGVKLYLIAVDPDVTSEVKTAFEDTAGNEGSARIFYMPRTFSMKKIKEVYDKINQMEKNRFMVKVFKRKKDTRLLFTFLGVGILISYCFLKVTPWLKKI
jgi:hypothetical protein